MKNCTERRPTNLKENGILTAEDMVERLRATSSRHVGVDLDLDA